MAKIAVLIGEMFEDVEYDKPAKKLQDEGHELVHVSSEENSVKGKHDSNVDIDEHIEDVMVDDFDALFVPGGFSPDNLRQNDDVVDFVREFVDSGKPIFMICHGPQLLLSADRVDGRVLTAWKTIQKDLELAGAQVLDEEVVEDKNIITSRQPEDIPAFCEAMLDRLAQA